MSAETVAAVCKGMESTDACRLTTKWEMKGVQTAALTSIAISLKRIADSIEGSKEGR